MAKYQETLFPMPKQKANQLSHHVSMAQLAELNPHNIPHEMIRDWLQVRHAKKSPVTETAWKRLNGQLAKCPNPVEAFEIMVTQGWASLNHTWINNHTKKQNPLDDLDSTDWIHRV